MADIRYAGDTYEFPAEGWDIWMFDGADRVSIPGVSDFNVTGAVATPVTKRSQHSVKKRAGKPSPLTVNATLEFWNPLLRGSKLCSRALTSSKTLRCQISSKPEVAFIEAATAATVRGVTIAAPDADTGRAIATVEGSDTSLDGVEAGMSLKVGGSSYVIDEINGTALTLLDVDAAVAVADTYTINEPQIQSQVFDVHVTQAPGGELTNTGSAEGENVTGAVVLEAVARIVLDFSVV